MQRQNTPFQHSDLNEPRMANIFSPPPQWTLEHRHASSALLTRWSTQIAWDMWCVIWSVCQGNWAAEWSFLHDWCFLALGQASWRLGNIDNTRRNGGSLDQQPPASRVQGTRHPTHPHLENTGGWTYEVSKVFCVMLRATYHNDRLEL